MLSTGRILASSIPLLFLAAILGSACAGGTAGHVSAMQRASIEAETFWFADLAALEKDRALNDAYDQVLARLDPDRLDDWGISPDDLTGVAWSDLGRPGQTGFLMGSLDLEKVREALDDLGWRKTTVADLEMWRARRGDDMAIGFVSKSLLVFGPEDAVRASLRRDEEDSFHGLQEVQQTVEGVGSFIVLDVRTRCDDLRGCRARSVAYAAAGESELERTERYVFRRDSDAGRGENQVLAALEDDVTVSDVQVSQKNAVVEATVRLDVDDYTPFPGRGTFVTLLALIPDNADSLQMVLINDYARVRELFDIDIPGADADDEKLTDYMMEVSLGPETSSGERDMTGLGQGPFISGFSQYGFQLLENREHLGFDVRNVDQAAVTQPPPVVLEVVIGRFDPDATDRAIDRCSECPPPDREEHGGIEFYSWGGDLRTDLDNRFSPPAFDAFGRGGRIAVLDRFVFRTVETPGMRSLISTYLGQRRSLADNPDMLLAARAMDGLGAYAGLILLDTEPYSLEGTLGELCAGLSSSDCNRIEAQLTDESGVLSEYEVLATGVGSDADGLFIAVAIVYGSARTAAADVSMFEEIIDSGSSRLTGQPWRDFFPDAVVWSDGRTLLAKLRTDRPRMWADIIFQRDALFIHE
ncbi:MAG: hypothetical protein IH956_01065 [Chloroflexi bacterium]|nr:hypothetical protein [Chloroflexota bacterium]